MNVGIVHGMSRGRATTSITPRVLKSFLFAFTAAVIVGEFLNPPSGSSARWLRDGSAPISAFDCENIVTVDHDVLMCSPLRYFLLMSWAE